MSIGECVVQKRGIWEMSDNQGETKEQFYIYIKGKKVTTFTIISVFIIPLCISLLANILTNSLKSNADSDTIGELQVSIKNIEKRLDDIENADDSKPNINVEGDNNFFNFGKLAQTSDELLDVSQGSGELVVNLDQPTWKLEDKILYDTKSGIEFTAGQVVNQEILLKYKNDTEEIYFWGQFNENNHWNDNCLINVYENNVLESIMEAKYDDGKLISYKQVAKTNSSTDTVWSISDKEHYEDYNSGITKNYIYTVYNQEIEYENASEEGMIRVDDFENIMKAVSTLEGYYSGNTSEGRYNDSTGSAYIAKYYEDGTIRFLYRGYFAGGYPEDSRNNEQDGPWGIVYAEDGPYYVRNVGSHTKGSADHKSNKALSIDDINKIVSEYNFECKLNWKES